MEWLWIKSRAITNNINYEKELKKPNDILATKERKMHFIKNTYLPWEKNVRRNNVRGKRPEKACDCVHIGKIRCMKQNAWVYAVIQMQKNNGILLPE